MAIECKRAKSAAWVTFPIEQGYLSSSQPIFHPALTDPKDFIRVGLLEEWWKRGSSIFGSEPVVSTGLLESDLGRSPSEKNPSRLDTAARALQQCWSAAKA